MNNINDIEKNQLNNDNFVKYQFNISVRELVEFVLREGDIDDTKSGNESLKSMQEGIKLHKRIQKSSGSAYHAEVPLKHKITCELFDVVIDGRADGIIFDNDEIPIIIDEIKGVHQDVKKFEEAKFVHKAQAIFYAYFVSNMYRLDNIDVQITYGNLDNNDIVSFKESYFYNELEAIVDDIVEKYMPFFEFEYNWLKIKKTSINDICFPFEYRNGQKALMAEVYRQIERNELLFIEAPTGVGKTISTIYPSLKALNDNDLDKIIYLTAKTVTKTVAIDTFLLLKDKGLKTKTLEITAKDKICLLENRKCSPMFCEYANGYYNRINDVLYEIIINEDNFTKDVIIKYALKYKVCPYELGIELTKWSDEIICDYNYVFDPKASALKFSSKNNIYLVDEAHNLVDRARNMYSASLVKEDVLNMKKVYSKYDEKLSKYFDRLNKEMLSLKKICKDNMVLTEIDKVLFAVYNLLIKLESFYEKRIEMKEREEALEFYFNLIKFAETSEFFDESYTIYCDYNNLGEFVIHFYNMNPANRLQDYLDNAVSTVFFSATLLPINYYKELLTTKKNTKAIYATSIFGISQRTLLIANDVTSKYSRRSIDEYNKIACYIKIMAEAKKGNYIAFFPSYVFMENVYNAFFDLENNCEIIMQSNNMSENERESFLNEFEVERNRSLVAFCVLGGIYSEGIDLNNDKLIGVAIVGTGLSQTNFENDLLVKYFDNMERNGYDYSYKFPGMNKVCQAAGRVIRTVEDKGVILLLDERLLQYSYKKIFPREWNDYKVVNINNVKEKIDLFWDE